MNLILQATLKTLEKSKFLLENLSDEQFCDASVAPYYSSIGSHVRHILNFYESICNFNAQNEIDLTVRNRDKKVETGCEAAKCKLIYLIEKLKTIDFTMTDSVLVIDDLGLGKIQMTYTYGAILSQANSHTIHHYAIINYILNGMKMPIKDYEFGYNPTSIETRLLN